MLSDPTKKGPRVTSSHAIWLICAVGALLTIEIRLASSLLIVIVLMVLGFFGRELSRLSGMDRLSVGLSLVLGVGAQVFLSLTLGFVGISPAISQWTAITMLGGLSLVSWWRNSSLEDRAKSLSTIDFFPSLSIALIALSLRHPWMLPYSLAVAAIERSFSKQSSNLKMRSFGLAIPLLFAGFLLATLLRSNQWWYLYLTGQSGYFESIAWSTSFWGLGEHPGLSGGSIAGYHWLSFAFLGVISQLALLEPWDALTKIGLPITQFAMASLLLHIPHSKDLKSTPLSSWIIVLLVVVGTGQNLFDSAYFGLITVLCMLTAVLSFYNNSRPNLYQLFVLFLISFTAIMSKTTAAVALAAVLSFGVLAWRQNHLSRSLLPLLILTSSGLTCYFVFFQDSIYTEASIARTQDSIASLVWVFINGVPYFGWIFVLLTALIAISSVSVSVRNQLLYAYLNSALVSWLIFGALSMTAAFAYQITNPSLFLVGALAAWGAQAGLQYQEPATLTPRQGLLTVSSLALGTGTGFVTPVIYNRVDAFLKLSESLGTNAWEFINDHLVYSIPVLLVGYALKRPRGTRVFHIILSLALCLGLIAGAQLDRARRVATWGPGVAVNWALNDSALPNDDLRAVGSYVRQNSDPDLIIATNDFCCFGSEWWKVIASNPEQHRLGTLKWWSTLEGTQWWTELESEYGVEGISRSLSDTLWGGDNYLIAAETQRRVLIQGLKFQVSSLPSPDQINRMTLSLEFANNPNSLIVDQLKSYGVSGYIVNLKLTPKRSWSEFANEIFRSGNFVYLELR